MDVRILFNLILRCSHCHTHNAVVAIQRLKQFFVIVQGVDAAPEHFIALQHCFGMAAMERGSVAKVVADVHAFAPVFDSINSFLATMAPDETYGFFAFTSLLLAWQQEHGPQDQSDITLSIDGFFHRHREVIDHPHSPPHNPLSHFPPPDHRSMNDLRPTSVTNFQPGLTSLPRFADAAA